jgi:hypothetical protein
MSDHKVIEEIRKLAAEYPDVVYESDDPGNCFYTQGKCGPGSGCIIGQAIQRAMPDKTPSLEYIDFNGVVGFYSMSSSVGLNMAAVDQGWASNVQILQDKKFTWAEAVEEADKQVAAREFAAMESANV